MSNISGTSGSDTLLGTSGKDTINGLQGADLMVGGDGDDGYFVDNVNDKVIELFDNGHDVVYSTINIVKLWDHVEDVELFGTAKNATGNNLANALTGNDLANVLDGGLNTDLLIGGKGNDVYIVDDIGDTVIEQNGEGTDLIKSSVSYTASSWVENITLTGKDDLTVTGNGLDNVITGNAGDNHLVGGAGKDTMIGGKGDDIYAVDDAGDKIVEAANQGMDTVFSSVNFSLADFANVEDLVLSGNADYATGNALGNSITGNAGNNVIDGGKGADTLIGGDGNDVYYLDNAADKVVENAGDGTADQVRSTVTIAKLAENVESLILDGTASINGTGNDLDNSLYGNDGKNILDGGIGKDYMAGGRGNDTYIVDNKLDTLVENANGGTDLVKSSVTFTLGNNIENLTLTGTDKIDATGNTLENILTGNDADNTLDGKSGKDTMIGGKGDDTYMVDDAGDKVVESVAGAAGGHDIVGSSVTFSLAALANIEDLALLGSDDINGTGNALINYLAGNGGANVLDGGKGADILEGRDGDDTYLIDNVGDTVTESKDQGYDTVISAIALGTAIANVEAYVFKTTAAVDFTGSSGSNVIAGGSGGDTIHGGGGQDSLNGGGGNDTLVGGDDQDNLNGGVGGDTLIGGKGDDLYVVDSAADKVSEISGEGHDAVFSTCTITKLFDNVEDLFLSGSGTINGTGNTLDNVIGGDVGKNTLDGGLGDDQLAGLAGNDTLIGGEGKDTFQFYLTHNDGKDVIKDFVKADDVLQFHAADSNGNMTGDLNDLLAQIGSVVDHGKDKDVVVNFLDGGSLTFTGLGTGAISSITDLVADPNTQIHVTV